MPAPAPACAHARARVHAGLRSCLRCRPRAASISLRAFYFAVRAYAVVRPRADGACAFYHMNGFMRFRRPPPFFSGPGRRLPAQAAFLAAAPSFPTGTRRSCPASVRRSLQCPLQNMLRAASVARSTPRPPAPARARAYLPGPCVRRKSAPRRPHACRHVVLACLPAAFCAAFSAAPRKAARRALRFLPNAAGPLQPAGFKYTKKHVAVRGQIALKY